METGRLCGEGLVRVVEGCLRWRALFDLFEDSEDFAKSLVRLYVAVLGFIIPAKHHYEKSRLGGYTSTIRPATNRRFRLFSAVMMSN